MDITFITFLYDGWSFSLL